MTDNRKKLTEEQLSEIRKLRQVGIKMRAIADEYGVSVPCIKYHTMNLPSMTVPEVLEAIA